MGRGKVVTEVNVDLSELTEDIEALKTQNDSLLEELNDISESIVSPPPPPPVLVRSNAVLTTRSPDIWQVQGNNAIALQDPGFSIPIFSTEDKLSQPGEYVEFNTAGRIFFGLASEVQESSWRRMNGGFYCRSLNDLRFSLKGDWGRDDPTRTVLQQNISSSRFRLLISAETELSWQIQDSSSGAFLTRYSYKPCFYGTLFPFGVGRIPNGYPAPELFDVVVGRYN